MNFRQRTTSEKPGFQIAPMIDVIFLLLCFFVASQIFSQWETEIDIQLPSADTGDVPDRLPGEIIINVRRDGAMVVNRRALDAEGMGQLLTKLSGLFPGQPVLLRADRQTPYEHIMLVLDLCRKADVWNISFAAAGPEKTVVP